MHQPRRRGHQCARTRGLDLRRWLAIGVLALALAFLMPPPFLAAASLEATSDSVQPFPVHELVFVATSSDTNYNGLNPADGSVTT